MTRPMTRLGPVLLAFALAWASGCRPAAEGEPVGVPGASGAGGETRTGQAGAPSRPRGSAELASTRGLPGALVAVAATPAAGASPCEQTCGQLGDCLFGDGQTSPASAGHLELECLDLCVHAPSAAPARAELLACGSSRECGALTQCVGGVWPKLQAVRQVREPTPAAAATGNDCNTACRWLVSCMNASSPPDAVQDSWTLQQMDDVCRDVCSQPDTAEYSQRTDVMRMGACAMDHCTDQTALFQCWSNTMASP